MDIFITALILIVVGVCIGIFSGMLGIGGGMLMVPVLRLGCGLNAFMATATSLFAIIPISISGAITHIRNKTCIPKLGVVLGIGGAITSSLGVYLGSISPAWLIMVAAAIIIVYSAYSMLKKAIKMGGSKKSKPGETAADKGEVGNVAACEISASAKQGEQKSSKSIHFPSSAFVFTPKRIAIAVAIGLLAGFASGYVGVGGGFIMVPLMGAWLGVPMKRTSGISLIAIIILAIPGVIQQAMLGHIDYLAGIFLCVGAIPGAILGAKLVPHIPERTLRFIFAGFLAVAAVLLVVNELGLLG